MNDITKKRRIVFYFMLTWLLIGSVLAVAAYYTYQNDFKSLSFSQDNNDTYVISESLLTKDVYKANNNSFIAIVDLEHYKLNYLRVTVEGVMDESKFSFFGTNSLIDEPIEKKVSFEDVKLHNGNNEFKIPTQDFTVAVFTFSDIDNIEIKRIEFRERIDKKPLEDGLKIVGIVLGVYALLSIFVGFLISLIYKRHKKLTNIIETRNNKVVAEKRWFNPSKLPIIFGSKAQALRIITTLSMVVLSLLLAMQGEDYYRNNCEVYVSIQLALTIILAASIPDNKCPIRKKLNKDKALITVWTALCLYTLASDLLVEKYYRFSWTGIYLVFMLLSTIWCSRKDNGRYIKDFGFAVQVFLILLVTTGVIMNPDMRVERYSGPLENPSIYALYLGGIWAVLLGLMENCIKSPESRIRTIIIVVEMIITAVFLYDSQSLTPIISALTVSVLWGFRMLALRLGNRKATIIFVVLGTAGIAGISILFTWVANSGAGFDSRIIAKLQSGNISSILSMRNHYWSAYLRNMNLFGHGHRPFLWGKRRLPHNALISMAYWYGVPVIVPYILMMIMSIEKAYRYANTKVACSAVPLYCIVAFVVMSMADNVEQPYVWLPWIACYLMMAPILVRSVDDIEKLKANDVIE